jgi:hypothetical protein
LRRLPRCHLQRSSHCGSRRCRRLLPHRIWPWPAPPHVVASSTSSLRSFAALPHRGDPVGGECFPFSITDDRSGVKRRSGGRHDLVEEAIVTATRSPSPTTTHPCPFLGHAGGAPDNGCLNGSSLEKVWVSYNVILKPILGYEASGVSLRPIPTLNA